MKERKKEGKGGLMKKGRKEIDGEKKKKKEGRRGR